MTSFFKHTHDIYTALQQQPQGENTPITGWSIDTRTLQKGNVFIALTGELPPPFATAFSGANDGHHYLKQAQEAGSALAIVSTPNPDINLPQIIVEDTFQALWQLAEYVRNHSNATFIGLTGSAGKTTCKDMLLTLLDAHGPVASYNNAWGVPLTMLRLPFTQKYCVLEIGMNQKGELAALAKLANPHIAIILNTLPVHTEGTGGVDGVKKEKLSLIEGLTPQGTLIINDNIDTTQTSLPEKTITFGEHSSSKILAAKNEHITACINNKNIEFDLNNPTKPRQINALVALLTAYIAGENIQEIAPKLAQTPTPQGRGNILNVNGITLIDDSYNANPASIKAALETLRTFPTTGKRYALLGDMKELGRDEILYHQDLAEHCHNIDGIFTCGDLMQHLATKLNKAQHLEHFKSAENIPLQHITSHLTQGDVLLIKGSKSVFFVHQTVQKLLSILQQN